MNLNLVQKNGYVPLSSFPVGGCFAYADISRGPWPLYGCSGLLSFVIFSPGAIGSELFHHLCQTLLIGSELVHHLCQTLLILIIDSEFSVTKHKCLSFHLFPCIHRQLSIVLCCYGKWDNFIFQLQEKRNKKLKVAKLIKTEKD